MMCEHNPDSKNSIGVEVRGVYDGVLYWQCDYCGHAWQRWPDGSRQHEQAKKYIDMQNEKMLNGG